MAQFDDHNGEVFAEMCERIWPMAIARDRDTEPEPRTITISDDEALAIVVLARMLYKVQKYITAQMQKRGEN